MQSVYNWRTDVDTKELRRLLSEEKCHCSGHLYWKKEAEQSHARQAVLTHALKCLDEAATAHGMKQHPLTVSALIGTSPAALALLEVVRAAESWSDAVEAGFASKVRPDIARAELVKALERYRAAGGR